MSSALPACAGVFTRAHCQHPRLFEEEYKRCFPHCCPHHVDRSYCGSSLEVVLRFGSESDVSQTVGQDNRGLLHVAPFDDANVFVFARFETVGGEPLSGAYSLRYLRSVSQNEVNPEASWMEGVRQTAADNQQHSQQMYGRQPTRLSSSRETTRPKSATFVLNGQAFAKWYYHWESGANKVQRASKHALKAYVFYQTQEAQTWVSVLATRSQYSRDQGLESTVQRGSARDGTLEMLCVVTSPPFTVVSYRRAPLDASSALAGSPSALRLDAEAALGPHYATDSSDSRLRYLVQHQISRAFREYNQQQQQQREYDPRGSSGESFEPFAASRSLGEQEEGQLRSDDRDRYRHLQEREGLRFHLLTPKDTALSGSSLHGRIQLWEPRLVFDSTRRRDDHPHWRDTSKEEDGESVDDYDEDDMRDEAVPQPLTPRSWMLRGAADYEVKASGPVGMPPSTTDPVRQAENAANAALQRFKQQQQQFDSHQRELQQLTDLAIIHFFVSSITTNSTRIPANFEVVFTIAISQHWRYASGGATHLARLLLSIANGTTVPPSNTGGSVTDNKREKLMLVLVEVCVWAFSPGNIELMQNLLYACYPILRESIKASGSGGTEDGGKELRMAFLDCVGRCWSALDGFLQTPRATQTTIRSVRELSDAVLGVIYSDPVLEELRSGMRTMLQRPTIVLEDSKENTSRGSGAYESVALRCNLAGWQGFVAQVREGYLRDQYSGRGRPWCPILDASARRSQWTADWQLQPGTLSVTPHVGRGGMQVGPASAQDVPSFWTSCLVLSQLLRLKLAVAGDPIHTLCVQAEPSVLSRDNAWLRLICDGRVRVAPVVPNGFTSLIGCASCGFGGDYVAYRIDQRSSNDSVEPTTQTANSANDNGLIGVEFYWWSLRQGEAQNRLAAFRSVLTLTTTASGAFMEGRMDLGRGFVECQAIAAAEFPELELWTPTERVKAVASWEPWLTSVGVYARK